MLVSRYRPVLYLQLLLIFIDIFLNCFMDMLRFENVIILVLYVLQDVCIVFAVIVVFLMFFNTYIFQAGLVQILIKKFKITIIVTFVYLALNIGLHIWTVTLRWDNPNAYVWNDGLSALYVIQKSVAVLYYYFYKRTALRLGDHRFYEDSQWLRHEFQKRR
ncbi:transmembrane protein 138-like [Tubulanus polymorphus]|uniref:transmembrane protein 138-like n=1 Tax=Tubulanus polymorphus TaxID=672921 RepID=UPI003DA1E5FF